MNTPNEVNTQNDFSPVEDKISEIASKSATGDYIYRGEPECYEKISSGLYRTLPDPEGVHFKITMESFQNAILEEARAYISEIDDIAKENDTTILTALQHFGGTTNLIDCTEDYLIALFFACDGSDEKEGRVILLKRESADYDIIEPRRIISRVESQKSVFIESPTGFVEPNIVVTIPAELKQPMLDYLRKTHGISIKIIYNDLHGFIRRSPYRELLKGLTSQGKALVAKTRDEKHVHYDDAIIHYTKALKLNPDSTKGYVNRAITYRHKGNFDAAIQDCNKAIELNPDYAQAYLNRGNAYREKGKFDIAIQDYSKAIELNPDYAIAYLNRGSTHGEKGKFDIAIQDYSKAIELNPDYAEAYLNRGLDYHSEGRFDRAIQDYSKAIELNPDYAEAYASRGEAWLHKSEWENAKADLIAARNMEFNIVDSFHNDYKSIEDFEEKQDVKVPKGLAALLRRN